MKIIAYFFWGFAGLLVVTFSILNAKEVMVNYYIDVAPIALPCLLLCALFLGVAFGTMTMFFPWVALKRKNHRLKQKIKVLFDAFDAPKKMTKKKA